MEICNVETGLLKKKPCGEKAVTKCANCEQALCSRHAVPRMSGGHKTFLCQECVRAWKQSEKTVGTLPATPAAAAPAKKPAAEPPKPAASPAPKPATASAPKPATAPAPKPAVAVAPKPAPVKPAAAPVQQKKSEPPPQENSGPLEFTLEPKDPEKK
jgi:hypothetical protein